MEHVDLFGGHCAVAVAVGGLVADGECPASDFCAHVVVCSKLLYWSEHFCVCISSIFYIESGLMNTHNAKITHVNKQLNIHRITCHPLQKTQDILGFNIDKYCDISVDILVLN